MCVSTDAVKRHVDVSLLALVRGGGGVGGVENHMELCFSVLFFTPLPQALPRDSLFFAAVGSLEQIQVEILGEALQTHCKLSANSLEHQPANLNHR